MDTTIPSFVVLNTSDKTIHLTIPETQAFLAEQGYTYNQVGFSYNQAGIIYGGFSAKNTDIVPIVITSLAENPHIIRITDVYS
ncbi:MAG: hypothetical protein ACYC6W_11800 [Nitrosotalea sp.]